MEICIFQTGEPLHIDKGNYRPMRCMLLADKLIEKGHKVIIISSDFFHQRKIHRFNRFKLIKVKKNLEIQLIPSIGYQKHVSLIRVIDHFILAFNLFLFLKKNKKFRPDKIFLGYPPILTSLVITKWCLKKRISFILDVKDKWPEHFIEPFPPFARSIAKFLLKPYFISTKYIFNKATKITSITDDYIDWIKCFSNDTKDSDRYFLSPLIRKPFQLSEEKFKDSINFWEKNNLDIVKDKYFCFIGSYTTSFDFQFIYKSAKLLIKSFPEVKFILCGSGDQYHNLSKEFSKLPNCKFLGEINKFNAKTLISYSVATLAPYINNKNFNNHIPNKIIESLENNTPFITTLDGKLKSIIEKYNNGIFIPNKDILDVSKFEKILNNQDYRNTLKNNAKYSYEKLFNFEKTFNQIENELCKI